MLIMAVYALEENMTDGQRIWHDRQNDRDAK